MSLFWCKVAFKRVKCVSESHCRHVHPCTGWVFSVDWFAASVPTASFWGAITAQQMQLQSTRRILSNMKLLLSQLPDHFFNCCVSSRLSEETTTRRKPEKSKTNLNPHIPSFLMEHAGRKVKIITFDKRELIRTSHERKRSVSKIKIVRLLFF